MHVVDTTLFLFADERRREALSHRQARMAARPYVLATLDGGPGRREYVERGGICTVPGFTLPGTFNYRLPLNPRRWAALLDALEPDLIEVGDAFHPAWCAWRVAQRRGIPLVAFYHSNLPQIIGRRIGSVSERTLGHYVRWFYERCDVVFAPSRSMCDFLNGLGVRHTMHQPLGVDTEIFCPAARHARSARQPGAAARIRVCSCTRAASRRRRTCRYCCRHSQASAIRIICLMIGGERASAPDAKHLAHAVSARQRGACAMARLRRRAGARRHQGDFRPRHSRGDGLRACPWWPRARAQFPNSSMKRWACSQSRAVRRAWPRRSSRSTSATSRRSARCARERVLRQFTWTQAFHTQTGMYANLLGTHRVPVAPVYGHRIGSPTS